MTQPLPPLPRHMAHLPRDRRGFPIPWFVAKRPDTGELDFRFADEEKKYRAMRFGLCWVCGGKLGRFHAYVIGPMCVVTRVTSEPPCHADCAIFSVQACPFLTRPRMRRNDTDVPDGTKAAPGIAIPRNPGVACVWIEDNRGSCRAKPFRVDGGFLIRLGNPVEVKWFAEGKRATRGEVLASIDSGYPLLMAEAEKDGADAVALLGKQRSDAEALIAHVPLQQPVAPDADSAPPDELFWYH